MRRTLINYLQLWLNSPDRKPLILRGARQVGKTWLVRHLAKISGKQLIELNFEKQPAYASLFSSNDPAQILLNLSAISNQEINIETSLLFLDEIQAAPELFSKLRWFAEDMPQLAIIAAGSLLEFVLADYAFSVPVGRVSYAYLEPMSFEEFLLASDKERLYDYLIQYDLSHEIPAIVHEQLITLLKEYLLVGGMPAVVSSWVTERSFTKINQIQNDLLATYRDDFNKYKGRLAIEKLDAVMMSIPRMLGQKFVFSHVSKELLAVTIKQILDLLEKARIAHRVQSTSANGVPLGAELKEKYFKEIFLDVGLSSAALGLNLQHIQSASEIITINNGAIAEQVVGQLLRTIDPPYIERALYCWHREEAGSNAEIDYIVQHGNQVIPIEVKAGSTGSLKSLHLFMGLKKLSLAVRFNSDYPSQVNVKVKNNIGEDVKYSLLSLPFYLVSQVSRLLTVNKDNGN